MRLCQLYAKQYHKGGSRYKSKLFLGFLDRQLLRSLANWIIAFGIFTVFEFDVIIFFGDCYLKKIGGIYGIYVFLG